MEKTYYPKAGDITRDWYVVDAAGQNLGRLATKIAEILMGKHKPSFTPGVDMGDFVIVLNCEKIVVTGNKLVDKKYYRHSGYPGGLTETTLKDQLLKHPDRVITAAVRGMLPSNNLGRHMLKKMKVYAGAEHPHAAQLPKPLELE
ncbi:MAG: 50S ribosomal protein L13 [Anaerolineales bacterium]|nr:50S ribosomal protein L13 [Anaerolineales bacterium]